MMVGGQKDRTERTDDREHPGNCTAVHRTGCAPQTAISQCLQTEQGDGVSSLAP